MYLATWLQPDLYLPNQNNRRRCFNPFLSRTVPFLSLLFSSSFMISTRFSSSPMTKWAKQSMQFLYFVLSFIVFSALDFLDSLLCIVLAYLDDFLEGVCSPCYCLNKKTRRETDADVEDEDEDAQVSETLYEHCRPNFFRVLGFCRRFDESSDQRRRFASDERKKDKVNRWSDCGCQSCVSWIMDAHDHLRLHFVVQGNSEDKSSENVIFLHGFISSSSFWTETVFCNLTRQAKKKYRLFAVDLLGFGRSPKPRDCLYTLKDHMDMIEKSIIFPFELNSFHLVAHSMGSIIALALAAKHPQAVKSLTLIAPPYTGSSGDDASSLALENFAGKKLWPPLHFGASFMSWYEHLGRIVCFIICRNHRIWESILRVFTWRRNLHFMIMDLTRHTHHSAWHTMHNVICGGAKFTDEFLEILRKMRVKITVIQGDEDQVVPLECCNNIKKTVPEVDVRIVPKTDHITVVLSRIKEFSQDLEAIWFSCS